MKQREIFEIEIQRNNVTPAEFLRYVRNRVDKAGGKYIRGDLDLDYFRRGDDLNFNIHHEEPELIGVHEKSVSRPYEMQTFIRNADGSMYNEICEFEFDDEKKGHGYYYLRNVNYIEKPFAEIVTAAREAIDTQREKNRSAWNRGVCEYALELIDGIEEAVTDGYACEDDICSPSMLERIMLNGADCWHSYSWGCSGVALWFNPSIAERLCSPSELERVNGGYGRKPNAREEWLDVQTRALTQASYKVRKAFIELTGEAKAERIM